MPLSHYISRNLFVVNTDAVEINVENTSELGRISLSNFVYIRILRSEPLPEYVAEYEVPRDGIGGGASHGIFEASVTHSTSTSFAVELNYENQNISRASDARTEFDRQSYDYLYVDPNEIESLRVYFEFEHGYYYEFDVMIAYRIGNKFYQKWSDQVFHYVAPLRAMKFKPDRIAEYYQGAEYGDLLPDFESYPPRLYNNPVHTYSNAAGYSDILARKKRIESYINRTFLPKEIMSPNLSINLDIRRLKLDPAQFTE